MMRDHRRISLIVLLAVLGDGAAVYAQGSHFGRVTTSAKSDAGSSSNRNGVTGAAGTSAAPRAAARAGSTRPDTTQKLTRAEASVSQTPRSSSWEQEPLRLAARPQASAPSRPHTYYPGMRPGRTVQQPVRLTTRATRTPATFGTPSRNHVPAGAGHHR